MPPPPPFTPLSSACTRPLGSGERQGTAVGRYLDKVSFSSSWIVRADTPLWTPYVLGGPPIPLLSDLCVLVVVSLLVEAVIVPVPVPAGDLRHGRQRLELLFVAAQQTSNLDAQPDVDN